MFLCDCTWGSVRLERTHRTLLHFKETFSDILYIAGRVAGPTILSPLLRAVCRGRSSRGRVVAIFLHLVTEEVEQKQRAYTPTAIAVAAA
jgi:hypothetical protein